MLKKAITYVDFDGNNQTEEFYFNLNASELASLQFVQAGEERLEELLKQLIETKDISKMIAMFSEVIEKSYGVRSDDGKRFIKSSKLFEEFQQTPAFDALLMELITDETGGAAAFFAGIIPANLNEQVEKNRATQRANRTVQLPPGDDGQSNDETPWLTEDRDPTKMELVKMTKVQLQQAMAAKQRRQRAAQSDDAEVEALRAALES